MDLIDRLAERRVLGRLVDDVRAGQSRALVLSGDPGVGKTALLDYLTKHAQGCRVARAAGAQSEMELAFSGLHQLCAPILDRLDSGPLPPRERTALAIAFGVSSGPPPDPFLVGLAVLGLLAQVAEERPLCLIDDEHSLDAATAQVLAFVASRLGEESIGLVFASRTPGRHLAGLPEQIVRGLPEADARWLLDSVLTGAIDARVRDRIVAETQGNPLALLELPRGLTLAELAGGFGLPGAVPLAGSIEKSFGQRVGALPHQSRRLLLLGAADPTGDPALLWRAAALLGIEVEAAKPVADSGLAELSTQVRFRHPLVRSATYRSASPQDRRATHRALADATDPRSIPDRRAWHRAQAAPGPDEEVATELERSAQRAQARGGLAAAAAFLKQAVTLTVDPVQRTGRALAAAEAHVQAGSFEVARNLMRVAESGPLSDSQHAHVDLIRAQLAFNTSRGSEASALLLQAARRLEHIDARLSRATYLDALSAAIFAGRLAPPDSDVLQVARAASTAPAPHWTPRAPDLLLDGLALLYQDGYAVGLPMLRQAVTTFSEDVSADQELRWLWLACVAAIRVWDDDGWESLSARHVQLARDAGALTELPLAIVSRAYVLLFAGELNSAASLIEEARTVKEATGSGLAPYGDMGLAALRGDEASTLALIEATIKDVTHRGEGVGITFAEWANALLNNGLGQYNKAMAAAQRASSYHDDLGSLLWTTVELVEAATRSGMVETAATAYDRLEVMTSTIDTEWALGIRARSRALLTQGVAAESLYREAIAHLGRTRIRTDLARAHLLYGEWLRRERRRIDAREQLRTAHHLFETMGMEAFAERARRELQATGETAQKRSDPSRHPELTAQEAQIARLARDGLSNPEIGVRLFISTRTVRCHMQNIFAKLGITSRTQLDRALPSGGATGQRPANRR